MPFGGPSAVHLLDPTFEGVLTAGERAIRSALQELRTKVPASAQSRGGGCVGGQMDSSTVTLREEHTGADSRYLRARLTTDGDLHIDGRDLGPVVATFWGAGNREYEWAIVVRAVHVPQFVAALAGDRTSNVLALLASRFAEDERFATRTFLDERTIPYEFWNRVGS